jgi:predicted RNase H-like HicB family nuclease
MQYPVFIHKDSKSEYGVIVPDLPGCFSAGKTMEDAIKNARKAIECHLEGMLQDGDPIPFKKPIESHLDNSDLADGILAIVDIDLAKISGKAKRIDITIPVKFLEQIDNYIVHHHRSNRSAFIAEAAMTYLASHSNEN